MSKILQKQKKVLILSPDFLTKGSPVVERTLAYNNFFMINGVETKLIKTPKNLIELVRLVIFIYKNSYKNILITMPSFRNWSLLFLPKINTILDIRDGWSIAMKSGYGGTSKPNKKKYYFAKFIEKLAIKVSTLTITCTPGLQDYLQNISNKEVLLVPNGYSKEDQNIVNKLLSDNKPNNIITFICAGKFSEYGKEKVILIIDKIEKKYKNKNIILKVVGADFKENKWIIDYIQKQIYSNIKYDYIDRVDRVQLYKLIIDSDVAISVIRDPSYDFGTKVFDYILCKKPILNYFDTENAFTEFFNGFFESNFSDKDISFLRSDLLNSKKEKLLGNLQ